MPRRLFVTTALPYANGAFHIGHIMEYIQADIWVRFQRMQGHEVHFMGADDSHGAPIMLAAEKAGKSPEQFVAEIQQGRRPYLEGFHISHDNWHSTHSPENVALSQDIFRRLKKAGLVYSKPVEQFFDPVKGMYLADRYLKGECPNCGAKDQYGDACENCSSVYSATALKNPYSTLSGAKPVLKTSDHFFFKLSDPKCREFLNAWVNRPGCLQHVGHHRARDGAPGMLASLRLEDGRELPVEHLFSHQGAAPQTALARSLGVEVSGSGYITVDTEQRTSEPFIYAAGDCTRLFAHQVVTAAHEGATAAQTLNYDLFKADELQGDTGATDA